MSTENPLRKVRNLLVNTYEKDTYNHLLKCEEKYKIKINTKVGVSDVFTINTFTTPTDLYKYALMAHFDFVITDTDFNPLFAVEFDEIGHFDDPEIIDRDKKKRKLCELFKFSLLRITQEYYNKSHGGLTILEYIIGYWLCDRDIQEAYKNGEISPDEYIDPSMILEMPGHKENMPFWIAKEERIALAKYHNNGVILERLPSIILCKDAENNYKMFGCIKVNSTFGFMAENYLLSQYFRINISELLDDLLTITIKQLIDQALAGKMKLQSIDVIIKRAKEFWTNHKEPKFKHSAEWFITAVARTEPISKTNEIHH